MKLCEFIKKELSGWGKIERIVFPLGIILIILISIAINDNKVALASAICGITYTILAGKGKISCYLFGLAGTFCYSYISYKNQLYGNLVLYMCYYFPMQVFGIFKWKNHLNKETYEIKKTYLNNKERVFYILSATVFTIICYITLIKYGDKSPIFDSITSIFSVFGLILTVKRCLEQWYIWVIVNGLSTLMWIEAYLSGSNCFATVIMWFTYFILSFYFLHSWKKNLKI